MRIYDTRLGRFLSVDPLSKDYPELTTYQFASNTPIQAVDLDGLEAAFAQVTGGGVLPLRGPYAASASASIGVILTYEKVGNATEKTWALTMYNTVGVGVGFGGAKSGGVSYGGYPNVDNAGQVMGLGGAVGAFIPGGRGAEFDISFQKDKDGKIQDVKMGGNYGPASQGVTQGLAAYANVTYTNQLAQYDFGNLTDKVVTEISKKLKLSVEDTKALINTLKDAYKLAQEVKQITDNMSTTTVKPPSSGNPEPPKTPATDPEPTDQKDQSTNKSSSTDQKTDKKKP